MSIPTEFIYQHKEKIKRILKSTQEAFEDRCVEDKDSPVYHVYLVSYPKGSEMGYQLVLSPPIVTQEPSYIFGSFVLADYKNDQWKFYLDQKEFGWNTWEVKDIIDQIEI